MSEELTPQQNEISLRDYVDLLRRRKYIVIQTFVVVIMVGLVVTFMTKPTYRTGCRIMVEGQAAAVAQYTNSDPLSPLFMPNTGHDIGTQIEVLQGETVLKEAFETCSVPPADVRLDIHEVANTDIIEIVAESTSAYFAEQIAKQLPTTYAKYVGGSRELEVEKALKDSQESLAREQRRLLGAEKALEDFKNRTRLPSVDADQSQKILQKNTADAELLKAAGEVAAAQVRLQSATADRQRQPDFVESTTRTTSEVQRDAIRTEIAKLNMQRTQMLRLYTEKSFQVGQIDTLIDEQKKLLDKTGNTSDITTRVPNPQIGYYDQHLAEARAALLVAQTAAAKARQNATVATAALAKYSKLDTEAGDLQRDLAQHQEAVITLQHAVTNLNLRKIAKHEPLTVITPAGKAEQVAPKKMTNLAYSAVVGLILGLGLALLQEFLDDRVNSPEDARRLLKTPILGYVPMIEKEEGRLLSQVRTSGSVLESYRVLRSNVQFATVGATVNSLLITSTIPGEGKSVTAANLAVAMAIDGRRVILVDADLRRPTVHIKFGIQQSPGLTNVLVGHTSIEDALRDTAVAGLQVLTAGPLPPNPAELLNSEPMQQLHLQLKEMADIVIFDSPPCLATADAQVMAANVDGVLYVIQFGETKKSGIRHAVEMLQQAHANILGVVFNKIELSTSQDGYYYGYYNYYQSATPDGQGRRRRTSTEFEALLPKNGNGNGEVASAAVAVAPRADAAPASGPEQGEQEDV